MKDDFYVGYMPKAPVSYAKLTPYVVIAVALITMIIAYSFSTGQKEFASSSFEFGELSELTGIVSLKPVPNIKVITGKDNNGRIAYKTIPLIGYGKFGAKGLVEGYIPKLEKTLTESVITLRGTLIYGDGITLFELTEQEKALVGVSNDLLDFKNLETKTTKKDAVDLVGEIIDPKCYFGVMKPGHGKPHKSCAIRCISGGIPPVLWANFDNEETAYYLLLGKDGEAINKEALVFVGDKIKIKGTVKKIEDWNVLYADIEQDVERIE